MSGWTWVSPTSATTLKVGASGSGPSRADTTQANPGLIPGHAKPPARQKYFSFVSRFSYRTFRGVFGASSPLTWAMTTSAKRTLGESTVPSVMIHFVMFYSSLRQITATEERFVHLPPGYERVVEGMAKMVRAELHVHIAF